MKVVDYILVTVVIGDGVNDVSMIQEVYVGLGMI